ncbi:TPR repeat region-containing protein [Streptomyces triticirhizae]|uniref:TPR repeat domain-containing protein n=1 Tax=Streptomyces triticirhizae TaxID=2483353 RepID=A0A3M2KZC4_9ACTN|nr:hypothetical protein [Streptomyces triticirhizae]RMI29996.1 hypothetical protein EBN88_27085 [Streptomyces triticirhizae]
MSGDVSFDKDDVEAESDGRPWTRRDDFKDEIDVDDMADTAAVYGQAAGEAGSAGELAEHATRTGQEAGEVNGEALIQDDRIDITAEGLQGNGAGMDEVVGTLVRAMNRALEASDEVDALIEGGDGGVGLDTILTMNVASATIARDNADEFYAAQDATNGTLPAGHALGPEPPIYVFDDVEYEGVLSGDSWVAPDNLAPAIREYYLELTAETASAVYQDIKDAIESYRRDLAEYGSELEAAGYDTSQGPLGLWHTDEMATFYGEELNRVLSEENPDPAEVAIYTAALGSVVDDVYDEHGNVREGADPANISFLDRFLSQLEPSSLATLGAMDTGAGGPDVGNAYVRNGSPGDAIAAAQQAVANGIQMLSDPEVGGYENADLLPQNIQHFLDADPSEWETQADFDEFNGFSTLMGAATVQGGEQFTHAMIDAAATVQDRATALNTPTTNASGYPAYEAGAGIEFHPEGLLNAAALNDGASASYLADADNVSRVVRDWSGFEGQDAAQNLLRVATLPSDGESFGEGEDDKLQAGYNVLQYVGERADSYFPHTANGDDPTRVHGLENAIADIAGHPEYLEQMSTAGTDGPSSFDGDGFTISDSDRHGLFQVLLSGEADQVSGFKADVLEYTGDAAYRAFSGDEGNLDSEMRSLGELNGALTNAEIAYLRRGDEVNDAREQFVYDTWQMAASELAGKLPGVGAALDAEVGETLGQGASRGVGLLSGVQPPDPTAQPYDEYRRYDEMVNGGVLEHHVIYDAARAADHESLRGKEEEAAIIPQYGGDWGALSDDDWQVVDRVEDRDPGQALTNASGDYLDAYETGRTDELEKRPEYYKFTPGERTEIALD